MELTIRNPPGAEAVDRASPRRKLEAEERHLTAQCVPPDRDSADAGAHALQQACAAYWAANLAIDRSLLGNEDPADSVGLRLHQKWTQALLAVLSLPANTADDERAKSAVLQSAVEIVLGQSTDGSLDRKDVAALLRSKLRS